MPEPQDGTAVQQLKTTEQAPASNPDRSQGRMPRWTSRDWLALSLLAALSLLLYLPGLGSYGIIDPSDGIYAEAAREMLERGDWLTPSANYKPFFEKPILIYWLIMCSYKVFGVAPFAARLPAALSAVACVVSLFVLTRQMLSRRAAFLSAVCLASMPLFAVIAHLSLTDLPLTFFMTVGGLGLLLHLRGKQSPALTLAAYASLALIILVKGPAPIVVLGLILAAYVALSKPRELKPWYRWWGQGLAAVKPLAGTAIVLAVAAPWYVAEGIATQGAFYYEFFVRQNLGRAVGAVNHQNPWWYYAPVFAVGFFPWWLVACLNGRALWSNISKPVLSSDRRALSLFSAVWVVIVVALFSAMKAKLATYILPAAPGLAILGGLTLDYWWRSKKGKSIIAFALPFVIAVPAALLFARPALERLLTLPPETLWIIGSALAFVFLLSLAAGIFALLNKPRKAVISMVAATLAACAAFVPSGLFADYWFSHKPLKELVERAQSDGAAIALYLRDSPAACFYRRGKVNELYTLLDLKLYAQDQSRPKSLLV
ncbi:MAG TPA: glycosyltransferase family 39 protein, partial [Candidatus Obscuribacterales bacterium]